MTRLSIPRLCSMLVLLALAAACGPVAPGPKATFAPAGPLATEFQAAEPQGADVTVQAGQPPLQYTVVAPSTPQFFTGPCTESQLVGPTLLLPAADGIDSGIKTSFSWSSLTCDVWGWEFQLCASEDCAAPEFSAYVSPHANIRLGWDLEVGSTHFWRVAAWLAEPPGGTRGPWSETRRLRVKQACTDASQLAGPALLHPEPDAVDSGIQTSFSWSELDCHVWGWEFELCATEDCQNPEFEAYLSPYSNIRLGGALEPGSTHYWRAAAWLTEAPGGERGPWSETRRLSVAEACSDVGDLLAPILQYPAEGSTQQAVESLAGHRPRLGWAARGGCQPTEFLVELFIDPESGPVLISHRTQEPVVEWEVDQDLLIGVTYFWRVAAMLGEQVGPFSSPWTFNTIGVEEGQPGAVMGRVWNDVCVRPPGWQPSDPLPEGCGYTEGGITGNADLDPGETGIAGVTVSYTAGACPPGADSVFNEVSDANGDYVIYLSPGSYCVWVDLSAGDNPAVLAGSWPTYPACYYDTMDPCTVELADGEMISGFNFGFEMPDPEADALGSISGTVWRDTNANGAHDALERGLANVEVRLSCVGCPGAGTPAFTMTDAQGHFVFESLASATYSVEVAREFPANLGILTSGGWTRPPVSGTWAAIQIVLAGGEERAGVDFGWSYLTLMRPAFQLKATLQFFQMLPTLQISRTSTPTPTPRFYIMPTATPRRLIVLPTPTPTKRFIILPPAPTATLAVKK